MSDQQLDYERAPKTQISVFNGFWRISTISALLILGIVAFLFFAVVAGQMVTGLVALLVGVVLSVVAALRL